MADDPGVVDTGQGQQCTFDFCFVFAFFLLLPTLRVPRGRRLEESVLAPSISFNLYSSGVLKSQYSAPVPLQNLNQKKKWHAGFFFCFLFFFS